MIKVAALVAVASALCACAASGGRAEEGPDLSAYMGLATWVDLYDPRVLARPEPSVAAMAKRGVRTLFFETSNYQQRRDIVRPDRVARFVEAAHAEGMAIVAWYVPSFANLARDTRRVSAALNFRTPGGEQFDSFALDIEARVVRSAPLRSARLVRLAQRVRAAFPDLALGAIVPAPRGMQRLPWYWPGFPFAELARNFDVFLPMGYFTYRSTKPRFSGVYTGLNISLLRAATGNPALPIHAIGGLARDASPAQVATFMRAAQTGRVVGASLYDFADTTPRQWRALQPSNRLATSD